MDYRVPNIITSDNAKLCTSVFGFRFRAINFNGFIVLHNVSFSSIPQSVAFKKIIQSPFGGIMSVNGFSYVATEIFEGSPNKLNGTEYLIFRSDEITHRPLFGEFIGDFMHRFYATLYDTNHTYQHCHIGNHLNGIQLLIPAKIII